MLYGIILLIAGFLILNFGAKLMKLYVVLYGASIGFTFMLFFLQGLAVSPLVRGITSVGAAAVTGILFYALYKFAAKLVLAIIASGFVLTVLHFFGVPVLTAVVLAMLAGLVTYILLSRHDAVTKMFIVLSSLHGGIIVVGGMLMITGAITIEQVSDGSFRELVFDGPARYLSALAFALIGIGLQARYWRAGDKHIEE